MANDTKFPTEVVELPSNGYFYPKESPLASGKVEMKYMTAREEDILTSPNLLKQGIAIDKLLETLIVDKKINLDDLLIGDKNALIVAARILAYGKEYEFVTFDDSGEEVSITVDLTTLVDKEIDVTDLTKGVNEFPFTLPNSERIITLRFLTHKDEKELEREAVALKKGSSSSVKPMTSRMKRIIASVDKKKKKQHINKFVDNELLSVDSLELRKYLNSINPDINMTTIATFPDGREEEVAVEITAQFFWPSA
jgi:hypothetical protein